MKTFILTQPVPEAFLKPLQDVVLLIARSWVAWVFFKAGVLKFQSWDVAVMLFEYEYSVPVFDPFMAALIATMIELTFPLLLAFGFGARWAAMMLFGFNIVAAISYPDLSVAGSKDHWMWGVLILSVMVFGAGRISIDHWVTKTTGAASEQQKGV
jgi:putative oxidoreductase